MSWKKKKKSWRHHVDVVKVQMQGKKKQKLDLEQKLQKKMHEIQRKQPQCYTHACV